MKSNERHTSVPCLPILAADGTTAASYTYDAWGNQLNSYTSGIGFLNPLRYRGYVYDQETKLYYLQSRYYDPEIGRFLNVDGIMAGISRNVRGYNLFSYCFNNPLVLCDSFGNWPQFLEDAIDWCEEKLKKVAEHIEEAAYTVYYDATKWHFEDRIEANGAHPSYEEVVADEEWRLLPPEESKYHMDEDGVDELKFVHNDGREAVFNGVTLKPMLNSKYMATYNYATIKALPSNARLKDYLSVGRSYVRHFRLDVLPYWLTLKCNTREDFEAKVISIFS